MTINLRTAALLAMAGGALIAQNPGVQRTILQRQDMSVPGREIVVARIEIAPHTSVGRHTHPGEETSYILEGEGEILVDGQPPLEVKPGSTFIIPMGVIHDARNTGTKPLKLAGVYTVEKGKPLATPVP